MSKLRLLFILLLTAAGFFAANAQNDPNAQKQQFDEPNRPRLLQELGLSQDQVRQIVKINGENKEKIRDANVRLREARENLDAAIYADVVDEALVQSKLREFHNAQTEVLKIRTMTELAIRKILTPEQLVRFRELRQKYEEMRRTNRQERMQNSQKRRLRGRQFP